MLFLLLLLISSASGDCPSGAVYDASFNRCYKYVSSPKSFNLAEQDCSSIFGHLASIQNGFENGLVAGTAPTYFGQSSYWIGAQNPTGSGSWSWTDGLPFSYSSWAVGQPDNSRACAYVDVNTYKWSSDVCTTARPYVCVVPQEVPTTQAPCPSTVAPHYGGYCEDGWTINSATASCYKVSFNKSFADAESQCKSQGAHLTSIHSAAENNFIIGLATTGLKLDSQEMTWIGLKKSKVKGWEWSDGTATDYFNWEEGEPSSIPLVEDNCASLISDQEKLKAKAYTFWRNIKCTKEQRAFVCKKKAQH